MGALRFGDRLSGGRAGFSLPELLAVLAILAIAVAVGVPIVTEQLRLADVRGAADDLAVNLRAARMISVTKHKEIDFKVVDSQTYKYEGGDGQERKIKISSRLWIAPASDSLIRFKQNGSVDVAGTIVLETHDSGPCERWTANVSTIGLATLVHERVN